MVHENHGVGVTRGSRRSIVDKISKDYMKISYARRKSIYTGNAAGSDPEIRKSRCQEPKLNKLGTPQMEQNKRTKVRGAVNRKRSGEAVRSETGTEGYVYGGYRLAERI